MGTQDLPNGRLTLSLELRALRKQVSSRLVSNTQVVDQANALLLAEHRAAFERSKEERALRRLPPPRPQPRPELIGSRSALNGWLNEGKVPLWPHLWAAVRVLARECRPPEPPDHRHWNILYVAAVSAPPLKRAATDPNVLSSSTQAPTDLRQCVVAAPGPAGIPDPRVPGYLGRVLHVGGSPVGTCFQAAPGVVVTAAHVLDEAGVGYVGAVVRVDALAGGVPAFEASVAVVDALHDLAVLTSAGVLATSVKGWSATDLIGLNTKTAITGVSEVDDDPTCRFADAIGRWAGGTTRDEQVPLGWLTADSVAKGMSGGPVRRVSDDFVIGVVSQRYNSLDGWLRDRVLVARVEDLRPLLVGIADIEVAGPPALTAAVDITLTVTDTQVWLHGGGINVTAAHSGIQPGLAAALIDVHRERARRAKTAVARTQTEKPVQKAQVRTVSLRRAGELAAQSFLPEPISQAFAEVLVRATAAHVPVRVGIEAGKFREVPWEAIPDPAQGRPWALHPLITVYRHVPAVPVRATRGPLRILVAIAAPTDGWGQVLDYERALRNVLAAVKAARQGTAQVRIVEFATTTAIRAELECFPAHVLHLSGHGIPGCLILETDTGTARKVTAKELVAEAIPPGAMPPVIGLAACFTDAPSEADGVSFAAALMAHGASAVIATETAVTDRYATALFARVYQDLANHPVPDVVAAVAQARRIIHQQWSGSPLPRDNHLAGLDEWGAVTVLAGSAAVEIYASGSTGGGADMPIPVVSVSGLVERETGDFVGRRRELRTLPTILTGNHYSGIVLHGLGGIGKTTLAAQLLQRQHWSELAIVITGAIDVDTLLTGIAQRVERYYLMESDTPPNHRVSQALGFLTRVDRTWAERVEVLRDCIFDHLPVLVVLDNFENNLDADHTLTDGAVAGLLAEWVTDPRRSRLLVTCRYPFTLPNDAQRLLLDHPVGPMTLAETFKLIWALPALDRLEDTELDRVWRLVGGHPRSLEYLDALLNKRIGRYRDITARLEAALATDPALRPALATGAALDAALATTITVIADDILLTELLTRLTPDAQRLLIGASVYREPVDSLALLFQTGTEDPVAAWTLNQTGTEHNDSAILNVHENHATSEESSSDRISPDMLDEIRPPLIEYHTDPCPPISADLRVAVLVSELMSHSLISVDTHRAEVLVHRATASALHGILDHAHRGGEYTAAHTHAAKYWMWRVQVWPQGRDADLHDRLEARQHYLHAGDVPAAIDVTEAICARLHTIGAWDHETTLTYQTLALLPMDSSDRARWYHRLGGIAQKLGDYVEAERRYQQSLTINEEIGNRAGIAGSLHNLGIIAQLRGNLTEAERRYRQSLTIKEEIDERAGIASSLRQLGIIAQERKDYVEAERHYQQSLTIEEQIDERAGIATSLHQLGTLAQELGDYVEAERRYQQSLTIKEEIGNRAGIAITLHQLGIIAQELGDYVEAERRYQQSLTIKEEIGNRAGIATSQSMLGKLAFDRNVFSSAIVWHIKALTLRMVMDLPEAVIDLCNLRRLRKLTGQREFHACATEILSLDEIKKLEELLADEN